MRSPTPTADKRLLWGAGLCGLLIIAGIAATAPPVRETSPVPTIYSAGEGGARAAYLLLRNLHFNVRAWEEPPVALPTPATNAVLILAEPTEAPAARERLALREFVKDGGRLLFCGDALTKFFPEITLPSRPAAAEPREFSAALPNAISHDAAHILLRPKTYWGRTTHAQLRLYGNPGAPVVVSWQIGSGEVLWWAAATPLTNDGIAKSDNLRLFLNSVATSSSGAPAQIYWDEYYHGQRSSLLSYIGKTPAAWASGQILLLALAVLFTFSRRSGPMITPAVSSRLSPLEFVDTMGALYLHANAASIPVEVSARHLRLELARRLGMPSNAPGDELATAAASRLNFDGPALALVLRAASLSPELPGLRPKGALTLVQDLSRFLAQLTSPQPLSKKTN